MQKFDVRIEIERAVLVHRLEAPSLADAEYVAESLAQGLPYTITLVLP